MTKHLGKGTIVNAAGAIAYVTQVKPFPKNRSVIESEEINPPGSYPTPELGDLEVEEMEVTYYFDSSLEDGDPLDVAIAANTAVTATVTLPTSPATVMGPVSCKVRSVEFEPITKKNWIGKKAILVRIA